MRKEFRLPDVGEGLTEADIVSWHVKPGDTVTVNQIIVDIETAKAVVELPSPYAGTVSALLVDAGQTVDVGTPIIAVEVPGADDAAPEPAQPGSEQPEPEQPEPEQPQQAAPDAPQEAPPARQPVLVGYGVKPGSTSRRPRKRPPTRPGSYPATPSMPPAGGGPAAGPVFPPGVQLPPGVPAPPRAPSAGQERPRALAKPPVRRLARDLGIDLGGLAGSGPEGLVTRDDVERAADAGRAGAEEAAGAAEVAPGREPLGRGRLGREPLRRPPRSGSRCAVCASTPPRRWWQARSPRRT